MAAFIFCLGLDWIGRPSFPDSHLTNIRTGFRISLAFNAYRFLPVGAMGDSAMARTAVIGGDHKLEFKTFNMAGINLRRYFLLTLHLSLPTLNGIKQRACIFACNH